MKEIIKISNLDTKFNNNNWEWEFEACLRHHTQKGWKIVAIEPSTTISGVVVATLERKTAAAA